MMMPNISVKMILLSMVVSLGAANLADAQVRLEIDPGLKAYEVKQSKLTGQLPIGTSESVKQLVDKWAAAFPHHHKGVAITPTLIKTSEASQAIMPNVEPIPEGAQIVAISYKMTDAQLNALQAKIGVRPIHIPVALDGIVLVVHHKNPLQGLTLAQVKEIFATRQNQEHSAARWQQIGLNGDVGPRPINVYGRDATSGTYTAFRDMALSGAEQRKDVFVQPGSMSVVVEVGTDEAGIGYAAAGFAGRSKKVRVVPLARKDGDSYTLPTNETVISGQYPLSRQLSFYAVPDSDGRLSHLVREFITFVLSRDGQELAHEEGFFPLPSDLAKQALENLERQGGAVAAFTAGSK